MPGVKRAGFTLLEVIIAVVIVSFITVAVYRFVRADLFAIKAASDLAAERSRMAGLVDFVRSELEDLPVQGQGLLLGNPGSIRDLASDELQWICRAGPGVLTTSGADEYRVTLAIQPVSARSSELEIGIRRQVTTQEEKTYNWLPLLRPAVALEVRYYDPRLNSWIDRWSDVNQRPAMVRLRIWQEADLSPMEAVLPVPSARSQGQPGIPQFSASQPGAVPVQLPQIPGSTGVVNPLQRPAVPVR